jgi:AcrR family transcriptional regulator
VRDGSGADEPAAQSAPRATPTRGRPRLPSTDRAILEATLRQLSERGFARMSVNAIAAEAGVGKPTVYLRWRSKAELATAAVEYFREGESAPASGDTRADLVLELQRFQKLRQQVLGMSFIGMLLAEEPHHPDLLDRYRQHMIRPRRQVIHSLLETAQARGELRPDANLDAAVTMLIGAYYAQYLGGDPFAENWAETIVDTLWSGLAAPPD